MTGTTKTLTAEHFLLTTLVVKVAVVAVLSTMLVRFPWFRRILLTEKRDWPERLHGQAAARLARRGVTRRPAEGPVDYLHRAMAHCPDLRLDLEAIRELYVALRYGPAPANEDLQRLKYKVGRLRP